MEEEARHILDGLKIDLDPRQVVGELPVSKQQMVEIAKALSTNARVLIMDGPTSALTAREIDDLFRIIRDLKEKGCGIVYISHRLEEIMELAEQGLVANLAVKDHSRLGRNRKHWNRSIWPIIRPCGNARKRRHSRPNSENSL